VCEIFPGFLPVPLFRSVLPPVSCAWIAPASATNALSVAAVNLFLMAFMAVVLSDGNEPRCYEMDQSHVTGYLPGDLSCLYDDDGIHLSLGCRVSVTIG
jgi:hypothetical protein